MNLPFRVPVPINGASLLFLSLALLPWISLYWTGVIYFASPLKWSLMLSAAAVVALIGGWLSAIRGRTSVRGFNRQTIDLGCASLTICLSVVAAASGWQSVYRSIEQHRPLKALGGPLFQANLYGTALLLGVLSLAYAISTLNARSGLKTRASRVQPNSVTLGDSCVLAATDTKACLVRLKPRMFASLRVLGWLIGVFLCLLMPLTASRTLLINTGLLFLVFSYYGSAARRRSSLKAMSCCAFFLTALALLCQLALPRLLGSFSSFSFFNTMDRIQSIGLGGSARLRTDEWKKSLDLLRASPWVGVGVGQYAYHSFELQLTPSYANVRREQVYSHSHNLFAQIAAETGLMGLGIVAIYLYWWLRVQQRATMTGARLLFITNIIVLIVHSSLEYPLWYWYYLMPFALYLGCTDQRVAFIFLTRFQSFLCATLISSAIGIGVCLEIVGLQAESAAYREWGRGQHRNAYRLAQQMSRNPLALPDAEQLLNYLESAEPERLAQKIALVERLIRWRPYPSVVYRYAILLAQAGRLEEAKRWFSHALQIYPSKYHFFSEQLVRTQPTPPLQSLQRFSALAREGWQN